MANDRLSMASVAVSVPQALASNKQRLLLQFRLVAGYLIVTAYGAAFTWGQAYVWVHVRSPWCEALLIASLLFEYAGLARLAAWMVRWVDVPLLGEQSVWRAPPVVLVSSGAPEGAEVDQVLSTARTLGRPILLVDLVELAANESGPWLDNVRAQLAAQGVQVSAQSILTPRPRETLNGVLAAAQAPYVVAGQLSQLYCQ